MKNLGYYNGEIGLIEDMKVPMTDRGLYFGDGIYDAAYSRNHIIYALEEHLTRFYGNLRRLDLNLDMGRDELRTLLCELVRKVDDGEQFVYWQATRGCALREHAYPENGEGRANLMIMLRPVKIRDRHNAMRLVSTEDKRYLYCDIKTLSLLPSVLTAQRAKAAGADECVMHRDGRVTECSHSNISMLKDGVFITPPADCYILPGVGRAHLLTACHALGIPTEERPFTMEELRNADELIVSSAGLLCCQAIELDGVPVGQKAPALLTRLQDHLFGDWFEKTSLTV
ncbi:MAG: aminotransferase class IV [Clostridia bacterium]|nr:aminotransferase class IV [Clostridia bacterium]